MCYYVYPYPYSLLFYFNRCVIMCILILIPYYSISNRCVIMCILILIPYYSISIDVLLCVSSSLLFYFYRCVIMCILILIPYYSISVDVFLTLFMCFLNFCDGSFVIIPQILWTCFFHNISVIVIFDRSLFYSSPAVIFFFL